MAKKGGVVLDFNAEAAKWDTAERKLRAKEIAAVIKAEFGLRKNMKALEFGCGTGLISLELAADLGGIDCVDTAEAMIKCLEEKIRQGENKNLRALCLNLESEILPEASYDLIFSSMALHHVADAPKMVRLFKNLLKNDGLLCIIDLDTDDGRFHQNEPAFKGYHGFDQLQLGAVLSAAGLSEVKARTFYRGMKKTEKETLPYSLFIMTGKKTF